jgi:nitrite reductase/ring-hydroxylating ferredoxin subunit
MSDPLYEPVTAAEAIAEKSFSTFTVKGVDIAICRFRDEYFAIKNHCSHADSTFIGGRMRGYRIMCPLHGATFDIRSGEATGAPATRPIDTYPVRVKDGMVEVDLGGAIKPAG